MAKAAIYAEEAKRLFVVEGFSLDAIVGMLSGKVSRKTLFNWKEQGEWESKRKEFLAQTKSTKAQLKNLVNLTLANAEKLPTPKNILALLRAIQAYESYGGIKPLFKGDDKKAQKDNLSPETIDMIKSMYGLR